jgi:hypothetical protein
VSADGSVIDSACFAGRPWLLLFHRGNWCPFCVAQVRELAAIYRALTDAGIGLVVISPQSETRTAALARRFDVPMSFLSDPGGRAAGALGIDAPGWPRPGSRPWDMPVILCCLPPFSLTRIPELSAATRPTITGCGRNPTLLSALPGGPALLPGPETPGSLGGPNFGE